jgi:hypothetical protein
MCVDTIQPLSFENLLLLEPLKTFSFWRLIRLPRLDQGSLSSFFWVLIDLIVELLGLIIKPFDDQTEPGSELKSSIK